VLYTGYATIETGGDQEILASKGHPNMDADHPAKGSVFHAGSQMAKSAMTLWMPARK
jgi:hypothetical protein